MRTARFEIRRGRTGAFRFVLIAANGEPLATSEHYKSKAACRKGIDAVFACFNGGASKPGYAGEPDIVDTTAK